MWGNGKLEHNTLTQVFGSFVQLAARNVLVIVQQGLLAGLRTNN